MYTSTSKRINAITNGETIRSIRKDNRYAVAFEVLGYENDTDTYKVQYGTEGMPFDYEQEFGTLEQAEKAIRKFANLRHWRIDGE